MRFYLYASTAKIDMLFGQLKGSSNRTVTSKVALGPSVARFESSAQVEHTQDFYKRLEKVEKALEADQRISTLDPNDIETLPAYCRETELWNVSLISKSYSSKDASGSEWGPSYCLFRDGGDVLALLVGSQANVIGSSSQSCASVSPSFSVDEYLLRVAEDYWAGKVEANSSIDTHLVGMLDFCGGAMAYIPPKMLRVLFRVFGVFQVDESDLVEVYRRGHPVFVGKPRFLVIGSPLYAALP